jgi:hypothetical protein
VGYPGSNSTYQINGIIWGALGISTPLKDIYLILFTQPWEERTLGDCCFDTGNGYVIVTQTKMMHHASLEFVETFVPNEEHLLACGDDIDDLFNKIRAGKAKLNPWALFRKVCKCMGLSGATNACSPLYKPFKDNAGFKSIVVSEILTLDQKIQAGIDYVKNHS